MTQNEFDRLPLLLRYAQVEAALDGVNRRGLLASIEDGSLRSWPPAPAARHRRYYLKADVARMAGLAMNQPKLDRLNGWLQRRELLELLGLGRKLFWDSCRAGLIRCEHERRPPWRLRVTWPPQACAPNEITPG